MLESGLVFFSSEMSTLEWPILRSSFSLLHICHENFCKAGLLGFYILMCTLNHPKAILVYLFKKKSKEQKSVMHLSSNVTNYTFSTQENFSQSFVPYLTMRKKSGFGNFSVV